MAQTIKLKRSATSGATPTTSQLELGEVAINTYDGKMYIKKNVGGTESIVEITGGSGGSSNLSGLSDVTISSAAADQLLQYNGSEWVNVSIAEASAIMKEYQFTATAGQSTFSGSDDNSETLSYTAGAIQVFLNGIFLDSAVDYTATNGTSIVLSETVDANDYLQVVAFKKKIGDGNVSVDTFTGDNSTTAFTLSVDPGDENNTRVFIDGVYQSKGNYSVSGTTLTFSTAPPTDTAVEVEIGNRVVTLDTLSDLDLPDDVKLRLGTDQDLQIYHDGSNSYVEDTGFGVLNLKGEIIRAGLSNQAYFDFIRSSYTPGSQGLRIGVGSANQHEIKSLGNNDLVLERNDDEKLRLTSTGIDVTGSVTADSAVIDSITIDGTEIDSSSSLLLDIAGNLTVNVDGTTVTLADDNINFGQFYNNASGQFNIYAPTQDKDIVFLGNDGGSTVTALTLDMSNAGKASFNHDVAVGGSLSITDSGQAQFGTGNDMQIYHNGAAGEINNTTGDFTIDSAGDIILDADGRDVYFADGGTNYFQVYNDVSNNVILNSVIQDKDIKFTGNDNGSTITALTLDMSDAGTANFNNNISLSDGKIANFGDSADGQIYHDGSHFRLRAATGNFNVQANDFHLTDANNSAVSFLVDHDGATSLRYNQVQKLATTSTGIDVTGTVTADGLTVDAALATINAPSNNADLILTEGGTNTDARIRNSNGILEIDADLNNEFGNSSIMFAVDGTDRLKIDRTGDIEFYEDTGTTPKFHWDAANERLGLGTTTPTQSLDIRSSGSGAAIKLRREDTSDEMLILIGSSYGYVQNTTGPLGLGGSGGDRDLFIATSGNVGINNTNPNFSLDISGADNSQLRLLGTDTNPTTLVMDYNSGGATGRVRIQNDDGDLKFTTNNGNVRQTILENGNVGIGTDSPSQLLNIEGATNPAILVTDTTNTTSLLLRSQNNTSSVGTTSNHPLVLETNGSERMRIDSSGKVGVGTTVPNRSDFNIHGANRTLASTTSQVAITASDSIAANIGGSLHFGARYDTTTTDFAPTGYVAGRRENATVNNYAGYLQFGVTQGNAGTIEAMRITSTGNVGIGTTDPKNQLHVNGGGYFTGFTNPNGSGVAGLELGFDGTQSVLQSYHRGTSSYKGINMNAAHVAFNIGGVEKARVHSNGNVGIGTSSPANKLQIGSMGSSGYSGNNFAIGDDTRVFATYLNPTSDAIEFYTNKKYAFLASGGTGYVGIGTASPNAKLELNVASGDGLLIKSADVSTIKMKGSGSVTDWGFAATYQAAGDFGIYASNSAGGDPITAGTAKMYFTSAGNVGIGSTSPGQKLDVAGNISGHAFIGRVNGSAPTADAAMYRAADNTLAFSTVSTERMRINSSGKVGIGGTVMDGQKLNIEGWVQSNTRTPANAWLIGRGTGGDGLAIGTSISSPYATWFQSGYLPTMGTSNHYALSFNPHGGNVGIATVNPTAKLHIVGGSSKVEHTNGGIIFVKAGGASSTNSDYMAAILRTDTAGYHVTADNGGFGSVADGLAIMNHGDLFFATAPTTGGGTNYPSGRVMIKSTGNVGIGTASPAAPLHVSKDLNSGGNILQLTNADSTYNQHLYVKFNSSKDIEFEGASGNGGIIMDPGSRGTRFQISSVDIGRFDSDGLRLEAGKGIKFSAHASGNILDDYEEGTWTPSFVASTTTVTVNSAKYTKIGQMVHITMYLANISPATSGDEQRITGLPFTIAPNSHYPAGTIGYVTNADVEGVGVLGATGQSYIYFHYIDGTSGAALTRANWNSIKSSGLALIISMSYMTDS